MTAVYMDSESALTAVIYTPCSKREPNKIQGDMPVAVNIDTMCYMYTCIPLRAAKTSTSLMLSVTIIKPDMATAATTTSVIPLLIATAALPTFVILR